MATKAPAKPGGKGVKGKGLNGKIGPVPVKVVIFVGAAVVAYLLYRHYKGSQTTSAGSNATPAADSTIPFTPQDSTGGGASGGGASPIDSGSPPPTPNQFPPIYNYYFGSENQPASGGNVSTPTVATAASSSQPTSSFSNPVLPAQVAGAFYSSASTPQPSAGIYSTILAKGSGTTQSTATPKLTPQAAVARGSGGTAVGSGSTLHKLGGGL